MNKLKISIDFDNTMDHDSVQKYAKSLIELGIDVHIVTARFDRVEKYTEEFLAYYKITDLTTQHKYLFEVAKTLNIPRENIHFMNMLPKYMFFNENPGFLWHLDDDEIEIEDINTHTKTKGIKFGGGGWKNKCKRLINIWNFNSSK